MQLRNEKISIIIPVYNVENFLKRCIDSVIKQTYKNLEIILVDDGSKDNSGKICDEFIKIDKRIKVYHKTNGGLSDARNFGIKKANGKYIYFLDSDDWISKDAIECLYNNLINYNADISCGYFYISSDYIDNIDIKKIIIKSYNKVDALKNLMYNSNYFTHTAWGKLYKIELFNDVEYPFGRIFEDIGTTYKLFSKSKKIVITNKIVNYYFKNIKSIMHQKYSKKEYDRVIMSKEELDFIKNNYPNITNAATFRLCYECCCTLSHIPFFSSDVKNLMIYIKKYRKICIKDKNLPIKKKFFIFSSYFGHLGIKMANIIKRK